MIGDPGSKFDFGTFVAYLIPGLLVEFVLLFAFDGIKIIITRHSIFYQLSLDLADTAAIVTIMAFLGYFLGLILDMIAHPLTLNDEIAEKERAYSDVLSQFSGITDNPQVVVIVSNIQDRDKRKVFIDSLSYRVSNEQNWARQNWHWAFYEFNRQIHMLIFLILCVVPAYFIIFMLATANYNIDMILLLGAGFATVIISFLLVKYRVEPFLRDARNTDCYVYYRHRAWIVFAYLIEKYIVTEPRNEQMSISQRQDKSKNKPPNRGLTSKSSTKNISTSEDQKDKPLNSLPVPTNGTTTVEENAG